IQPDVVIYTTLIYGFAKANRPDDAERLLQQMQGAGIHPDVVTYNTLIEAYVKACKFERAKMHFRNSAFFSSRLQPVLNKTTQQLDLHNMSHAVARIAMVLLAESSISDVIIIHGKGLHSRHESFATMENIVQDVILEFHPRLKAEPVTDDSGAVNTGRTRLVRL